MNQELSTTEAKQMKPIIFSTPMVRAILAGRKTQTRRQMKPQPGFYVGQIIKPGDEQFFHPGEKDGWRSSRVWKLMEPSGTNGGCLTVSYKCRYGKVGDILYVRETWGVFAGIEENNPYIYRADGCWNASGVDGPVHVEGNRWRPSIHMPKVAARIFLKITDISVERLQDITEEDAIAEGLAKITKDQGRTWKYGIPDKDGLPGNDDTGWDWQTWSVNPIEAFSLLWRKINGEGSWEQNPWIWKITFEQTAQHKEDARQ